MNSGDLNLDHYYSFLEQNSILAQEIALDWSEFGDAKLYFGIIAHGWRCSNTFSLTIQKISTIFPFQSSH